MALEQIQLELDPATPVPEEVSAFVAEADRRVDELIDAIWLTDELRRERPDPVDEARSLLYYLIEMVTDGVPQLLDDIDAALREIDRIWWRTPQYTADITVGDIVAIWRSGKKAGLIGVGRVLAPPQEHAPGNDDARFALVEDSTSAEVERTGAIFPGPPFFPPLEVSRRPSMKIWSRATCGL